MTDLRVLSPFPLGRIRPEGFLYEQLRRAKDGMTGHLWELEPEMFHHPYLKKGERSMVRNWSPENMDAWTGEIAANYYTGYIKTAFLLQDEDMIAHATAWIEGAMDNQQPDGYLGTYRHPDSLIYEDYNAFATACAMRALIAFYEATGRKDVLEAVHRTLLWFCDKWANNKTLYGGSAISAQMIETYRLTGDERLVRFAEDFIEHLAKHSIYGNSYLDMLADELPYTLNHTVGAVGTLKNPCELYTATGKEIYLRAAENQIRKLKERAMHLTGSPVSMSEYLGPVGSTTETEYCCYTRLGQSYASLLAATGNAVYGEYYEEMFYNGAEGARKKDERALAYLSAPNQHYATNLSSTSIDDYQIYSPCFLVSCCAANGTCTVPEFVQSLWMKDSADTLYATMYGPCVLDYGKVRIKEETMYPFRHLVRFRVEEGDACRIALRIPSWAKGYTLTRNGSTEAVYEKGTFLHLATPLAKGDTLEIAFSAEIEIVKVRDDDYMAKHPIAIRYGALVFAYHIPERWEPYRDDRLHQWQDGFTAYNVFPRCADADGMGKHAAERSWRDRISFNIALDEQLSPADFTIEERDTAAYVWEDPPVRLHTHAYKAPDLYSPLSQKTLEPYLEYQRVTEKLPLVLEPYGCTTLRVTYFPKADLSARGANPALERNEA